MNIISNSDKRAFICSAFFVKPAESTFVNYPGNGCKLQPFGELSRIHFSDVSFSQSDSVNGEPVEQNIQFVFRGQSKLFDEQIKLLTGEPNYILLNYSNGATLVVGTKDNPVLFSIVKSGRVVENSIESKRFSAEPAKYLI